MVMVMVMVMVPPSVIGAMADSGGPSNNWDQRAAGAGPIRHTERIQLLKCTNCINTLEQLYNILH